MSILFITHDLGVIAEIADDVTVMYLGKVVETGPVHNFFDEPKHPYSQSACSRQYRVCSPHLRERLPSISGSIPHPQNRPTGMFVPSAVPILHRWRLRCARAASFDQREFADQDVSCFLYEDRVDDDRRPRKTATGNGVC